MSALLFRISAVCAVVSAMLTASAEPVSFSKDVQPILWGQCAACHKPGKAKGKLDLTSYAALAKGGEGGQTVVAGKPNDSDLIAQVIAHDGKPPAMPEKGDPLSAAQVDTLRRWIAEGAKDDTIAAVVKAGYCNPGPTPPAEPPIYKQAPAIGAIAVSPDGKALAVAGRFEVLLLASDSGTVRSRLAFGSPRITSLVFSADGKMLYAAGGSPGRWGHVQTWQIATADASDPSTAALSGHVRHNWAISGDTVFGLSVSPDGRFAAVGCADGTVRAIDLVDGREVLVSASHTDWVFGVAFTADGSRLVTTGRDKSVKRIDLPPADAKASPSSPVVVDIAEPTVPGTCIARSPTDDLVVVGTDNGEPRLYRFSELTMRTEQKKDPNLVKPCEKVAAPANAVLFSPDGKLFAAAGKAEVKVYKKDGGRQTTISVPGGQVYAIAFSPDAGRLYAAGFDGAVRALDIKSAKVTATVVPSVWAK